MEKKRKRDKRGWILCSAQSRSREGGADKRKSSVRRALYLYYKDEAETRTQSHRLSLSLSLSLTVDSGLGRDLILRVLFEYFR